MIIHNVHKLTRFDMGLTEDEYNDLLIDLTLLIKDTVQKYDPNKTPPICENPISSVGGKPFTITVNKENYT